MSRITLPIDSFAGIRWEASADSPIAEPTADIASSSGTPAAISAPKATSRITRVSGRLISSARWKSLPIVSDMPLLIEA
jgi:hypothetical protein